MNTEVANRIFGIATSLGGWGIAVLTLAYFMFFPEKAEKFSAILYGLLKKIWKGAEKKYIVHDVQSKVNDYVNNYLKDQIKDYDPVAVKIEWVNEKISPETFFNNKQLILRMRMSDNQNRNFVNAAIVFISENVLVKAKRYISKKQRETIDVFVAKKLFEKENEDIMKEFVDSFLIEKTDDEKVGNIFEKFNYIDQAGLFFPVFVQEMTFLGEKVFAGRKDQEIYKEVNGLVDFLNSYANRKLGEDSQQKCFDGLYCKFGITIVGKSDKISNQGAKPYKNYVKGLCEKGVETIYLIGNLKHKEFMKNTVCDQEFLKKIGLEVFNEKEYKSVVHKIDGAAKEVINNLIVLRKSKIKHYQERR